MKAETLVDVVRGPSRAGRVTKPDDNLNEALIEALRELGDSATPEELRAQGVRRVRRVRREMLSLLIEKAVNRTLMERTLGVGQEELVELVRRAQDEFNHMLGQQDEIDRAREQIGARRIALRDELARIRTEFAARGEDRARRRREIEREEDELLAAGLRAAFARLERLPPEVRRLEREVLSRAMESLEVARASALMAGRQESTEIVGELERRVAKLVQSLEASEQALARVGPLLKLESGLESIYRTVQGLQGADPSVEAKKELMRAIFEKNLELLRLAKAQVS
jgi:hypothetical protein